MVKVGVVSSQRLDGNCLSARRYLGDCFCCGKAQTCKLTPSHVERTRLASVHMIATQQAAADAVAAYLACVEEEGSG